MKNEKSVNNVSESRQRMHMELQLSVLNYQSNGGKITVCKPQKTPKSRKVTGKSKLAFSSAEPINRPSNAWDILLTA